MKATGAQLVAIDLPGCGGSDDLRRYGPDEMLNAVGEAIVQLKARYLTGGDRSSSCTILSHDWGGFVSYRIAAETVGLVDRVVAINIGYVSARRKSRNYLGCARERPLTSPTDAGDEKQFAVSNRGISNLFRYLDSQLYESEPGVLCLAVNRSTGHAAAHV